jgi:hypothetical protein
MSHVWHKCCYRSLRRNRVPRADGRFLNYVMERVPTRKDWLHRPEKLESLHGSSLR